MANFLDINGVKTLKYYFEKLVENKGHLLLTVMDHQEYQCLFNQREV